MCERTLKRSRQVEFLNYGRTMGKASMEKGALRNISLSWLFLEYRQFCVAHMKQTILILCVGVPKGSLVCGKNYK